MDIDCDIETNIRPLVIEYVKHKYGKDSVCGISTLGILKGKSSLLAASKVYGLKMNGETTSFLGLETEIAKYAVSICDDEFHMSINDLLDDRKGIDNKGKTVVIQGLLNKFKDNPDAINIIKWASNIEGLASQYGQHAAGVVITDGKPVSDYIPLMWSKKNNIMTTQIDKDQVEANGLLKMDFLGLNNLTIISDTLKEITKVGEFIDIDKIDINDKKVYKKIYEAGLTNSIFQFESSGMKDMLKKFKPESFSDLTLLVAAYRPGPMQYLENIIAVKNKEISISYLTPELEPILKDTYGSIIYQEQVQEIFKQLAGYSLGQADLVRRAMGKKKEKIIKAEKESFIHGDSSRNIKGCVANGISENIATKLFEQMTEFAKYAFNKSHAACYALTSYQTAFLKLYYPLQYMKAVLSNSPFDKVPELTSDLKALGIKTFIPDINKAELNFSVKDDGIMFGFSSIKGLGDSVGLIIEDRNLNGEYSSLADFVKRLLPSKKILESFCYAGSFNSFNSNKKAVARVITEMLALIPKIKRQKDNINSETDDVKREKYQAKYIDLIDELNEISFPDISDNKIESCLYENEYLGSFVSIHPADLYEENKKYNFTGLITDYEVKESKKGNVYATFNISNRNEKKKVLVFSDTLQKVMDDLDNNIVMSVRYDQKDGRYFLKDAVKATVKNDKMAICELSPFENPNEVVKNELKKYKEVPENGYRLCFMWLGEHRKTDMFVGKEIKNVTTRKIKLIN